jgi:RNA recognition motif-containing protein
MKIYVGNLSKGTSEPQLRESFEKFGEITSLNIIKDRETGEARGFAFVEMPSDDHAKAAISGLNGNDTLGSPLKVNEANKK